MATKPTPYGDIGKILDNTGWYTDDETPDPEDLPRPFAWHLLVRPLDTSKKTKGGIVLPDQTREEQAVTQYMGRVIEIGPLCWTKEEHQEPIVQPDSEGNIWIVDRVFKPWCAAGDVVFYTKYAGAKLICGGVKYIVLNDDEVLGLVTNPELMRVW